MAGSTTITITKKNAVWDGFKGFVVVEIEWVTQAAGSCILYFR